MPKKQQKPERPFRFNETELAIIANLDDMAPGAQRSFELPFRTDYRGRRMYERLSRIVKWYEDYKNPPGVKVKEYQHVYFGTTGGSIGTVNLRFERSE